MSSFFLSNALRVTRLGFLMLFVTVAWMFWYGVNSDNDDIRPLLTQLIPAGHCACESSTIFECPSCLSVPQTTVLNSDPSAHWEYVYQRDGKNEGLAEDQCNAAFPGLFEDVNRAVKIWRMQGNITQQTLDDVRLVTSMTRALIYRGNLYVVASKSKGEDHRRKVIAVLGAIHRALTSSANRRDLPNIEFIFTVEDKVTDVAGPGHPLWALTRRAPEETLWLMPDFGFWAFDMFDRDAEIGPYEEVVDNALRIEQHLDFTAKQQKLVWRGKLSFAPKLRRALLEQSRGHLWSDVKEVNWRQQENYLPLEDQCKYQFIAHAEGRSYSASLKYRQACRSVVIIHKLQYIQHYHYLLISSGPLQNFVQVERDFSDLPEKMSNLLDHPAKAQKIADNSVKTFRERYLTPAAEACYWRALWRGYGQVSDTAELWTLGAGGSKEKRGMRYESFILLSGQDMLDFAYSASATTSMYSASPEPSR